MSEQLLQDLLLTRSIANEFKIISTEQEQHAWEEILASDDAGEAWSKLKEQVFTLELSLALTYGSTLQVVYTGTRTVDFICSCHTPLFDRQRQRQANEQLARLFNQAVTDGEEYPLLAVYSSFNSYIASLPPPVVPLEDTDAVIPQVKAPSDYILKDMLFWSHHLLATGKRKDIIHWASELSLFGISKPGYPGVIVVEGLKADVDEFSRRIKSLNWQALQVRSENETAPIPSPCDIPLPSRLIWVLRNYCKLSKVLDCSMKAKIGVREVETMGEVGEIMRSAGMESAFLAALKLSK